MKIQQKLLADQNRILNAKANVEQEEVAMRVIKEHHGGSNISIWTQQLQGVCNNYPIHSELMK